MTRSDATAARAAFDAHSRTVLITGAARRLGRAIALGFAGQGWHVAVHCHTSRAAADALVEQIVGLGQRAVVLQGELGDEAYAAGLVDACTRALARPDCVINNASLFEPDTAADFGYAAFTRMMQANVAAPLALARALHAAHADRVRGADGTAATEAAARPAVMINLLDQKLFNLNPDYLSYTLSKAALQTATVTLAQALAPVLRVVGVAPGITLRSGDQSDASFARAHAMTPLGRSSRPEDIVAACLYLAGADAVTGTTLLVDGGQHLLPTERDIMFLTGA
ncbi:SDR family oxidoreductase [Chitinasiproducens palmae]|uniref:NAD(P)-dependent dehydrogenase, short-chain alcohol dehydrogenase family n=1 Tax=Chitinasiproducens palmae TaxID=1770053 RepID=A0A1H2PTC8_9BURK|nr:SDR family oxidoreductase [Chitinasiproducens palmae]SDV50334.1 NAD(P)-dependent dehydrogenase, short-chain alcohol dehydrogenase family [Chitinasiproducens palmae]